MNMIVQWVAVMVLLVIVVWIVVRKCMALVRSRGKRPCSGCPSASSCVLHNEVPERCEGHPYVRKRQKVDAKKGEEG